MESYNDPQSARRGSEPRSPSLLQFNGIATNIKGSTVAVKLPVRFREQTQLQKLPLSSPSKIIQQTSIKMRFSLTTIAIALLGSAMALPNPNVNSVEERAAVRISTKLRRPTSTRSADNFGLYSNAAMNSIIATPRRTAAVV